jgi:hypothetical protein
MTLIFKKGRLVRVCIASKAYIDSPTKASGIVVRGPGNPENNRRGRESREMQIREWKIFACGEIDLSTPIKRLAERFIDAIRL